MHEKGAQGFSPFIWDLTNGIQYGCWTSSAYNDLLPCLLRGHRYYHLGSSESKIKIELVVFLCVVILVLTVLELQSEAGSVLFLAWNCFGDKVLRPW